MEQYEQLTSFTFGNFNSMSKGLLIKSKSSTEDNNRELQTFSVLGRSGDLVRDAGRNSNYDVTYECRVVDHSKISDVRTALKDNVGEYKSLSDTYIGTIGQAYVKSTRLSFLPHGIVDFAVTFSVYNDESGD